ncbi:MAG: Bacterial transcription activator, effector binding domain [Chitinophagaceae bacterium]|nr:Bacterial transcription activator, effector binding domain [Chitinophagaceae bacterium]
MKTEIIHKELTLDLSGFSGIAANKDYAGTAFRLMDKIWPIIRSNGLKHKGLNIWVYEPGDKVFAGVEFESIPNPHLGLEQKKITLEKYAYYKHIGPYSLIKHAGANMRNELRENGFEAGSLYIEIYGHWNNDESKLETELLISVR